MGPKVLFDPTQYKGKTGIVRTLNGWSAVVRGHMAGSWYGAGSKRTAIQTAGTNMVLS